MKLESIYNHLVKLGVLENSIRMEEILMDSFLGDQLLEPALSKEDQNDKLTDNDWSFVSLETQMNVDDEFFVINGGGEILLISEEEKEDVGYIHFRIYNSNQLNKFQLLDAADAISGDEEWQMSTFLELFQEELDEWSPKFLMLNTIFINPPFRSKGFGTTAIKELIKLCSVLEIDYMVLKPSPIENVDFSDENRIKRRSDIDKLVTYYEQIGFTSYSLNNKEPIMVFDVNDFILN